MATCPHCGEEVDDVVDHLVGRVADLEDRVEQLEQQQQKIAEESQEAVDTVTSRLQEARDLMGLNEEDKD